MLVRLATLIKNSLAIYLLAITLVAVGAACSSGGGSTDSDSAAADPTVEAMSTRSVDPTDTPAVTSTPAEAVDDLPLNQTITTAPDFTLPNANGPEITLSELSAQKPVVLVFYRAFW